MIVAVPSVVFAGLYDDSVGFFWTNSPPFRPIDAPWPYNWYLEGLEPGRYGWTRH